jgi:hypothetical protein
MIFLGLRIILQHHDFKEYSLIVALKYSSLNHDGMVKPLQTYSSFFWLGPKGGLSLK